MAFSLTYHLTIFIIKLKGLKKIFSKDPIDFKKLRKEDVHNPKGLFFQSNQINKFTISSTSVTELQQEVSSDQLLIFIHGGAFISGPAKHHWDTIQTLYNRSNYNIWMCDYPKAPENKISVISENIDAVYNNALEKYDGERIVLIGDSVGGTLITALVQRMIKNGQKLPNKIILVSPVMNATMTNPEIDSIDKLDPMLSKTGLLSAKKMCAENEDLTNIMISPLNGSFEKFPTTLFFLGENDITYPDQKLAVQKLIMAGTNIEVVQGTRMPHIWPFLPVMKEAKEGLKLIIDRLNT